MQPLVRARLLISGRVQGVFYRAFTRDIANYIGLKGWVRNLPDGRVEAVFEGRREDIEQAIKECFSGPPGAKVNNIDVEWEGYRGDLKEFQIRYY
ncbi:MAG: acylphosphatase [Thermodesulfovibrionales bacterium]